MRKVAVVNNHCFLEKLMNRWKLGTIQILQGSDSFLQLPYLVHEMSVTNIFIICSNRFKNTILWESVMTCFEQMNIQVCEYHDVSNNPKDYEIMQGARECKRAASELVVAIGGGSILDAGKSVAFLSKTDEDIISFEYRNKKSIHDKLPLICIPTTVGTGSESSKNAVITNSQTHKKYRIIDGALRSDVVILDPMLTLSLDPLQSMSGGIDAFAHAFESFTNAISCTYFNAYYDSLALESMRLIYENIKYVRDNPNHIHARELMQQGAFLAGIVMENDLNANHNLAGTLHQFYPRMNHGQAVGILLPYVMEANLKGCVNRYVRLGERLGIVKGNEDDETYAMSLVEHMKQLLRDIHFPVLSDFVECEGDLKNIVKEAYKNVHHDCNPVLLSESDIESIFIKAYHEV